MPEISLFYGIRITMYYDDHNPPHFHAEYNGNKYYFNSTNGAMQTGFRVVEGITYYFNPSKGGAMAVSTDLQLKLILAWCVIHQDELMQNWELSKDGLPLNRINPLI